MALDYASIGLRIKHARTNKSWTQDKLAEKLKISRTQLAYLETGERGVSLETLVNISNVLEAPIADLLADNLTGPQVLTDTDLHYIMLDTTKDEQRIITKTAQTLKVLLKEYGI